MKCPTCIETTLVMTERQGIEIDYCPQCRGVWLDRGELDKIIERTDQASAPSQPAAQEYPRYRDDDDYKTGRSRHHRGPGSFLKDLFD